MKGKKSGSGKMHNMAHHTIKAKKGDKMAHSSHHDNHGEGDQAGLHGYGQNMAPPDDACQGDSYGGNGMGGNCGMED